MTPPPKTAEMAVEVLLLTQEQCEPCDRARELLGRLSQEYPLSIQAVELNSARGRELAAGGGIPFPPGVFLDREPFSYGRLSERRLRRELEQRLARA